MNFYEKSFSDPTTYLEFLKVLNQRLSSSFSEQDWKSALDSKFLFPDEEKPDLYAMGDAFIDFLVQENALIRNKDGNFHSDKIKLNRQIQLTSKYIEDAKSPIYG
ncbi:MAG: hypothetical protein VXV96_08830 [Bdellovibrionota bacterium]|nr:hypothetical protein [Bdellovibrionota bacterium]